MGSVVVSECKVRIAFVWGVVRKTTPTRFPNLSVAMPAKAKKNISKLKHANHPRVSPQKDKDKETSWIGTINVKMHLQVTGALKLMEETPYIKTAFDAALRTIAQGANQAPFKLISLTAASKKIMKMLAF